MLVFRILGTVFTGLSCVSCFFKNINIFSKSDKSVIVATVYGWLWRALVIVALWII